MEFVVTAEDPGSSPRARGALAQAGHIAHYLGLIPASAGSTLYDQRIFEPKCHSSFNLYDPLLTSPLEPLHPAARGLKN